MNYNLFRSFERGWAWYAHRWALWAGEELAHWPCSELDYTMVGGRGEGGRRGGRCLLNTCFSALPPQSTQVPHYSNS